MLTAGIEESVSAWQRFGVRIGERLRQAREARGVGLRELARLMEKEPGGLSKIESGETKKPEFETIALAAEKLGITLDELQRGAFEEAPLSPVVLGHYARARFRAWRREGLRITEIARRSGLAIGQVRRVWGGAPMGETLAEAFALGLKMRDATELGASAREWWRSVGRNLVPASRPDEDTIEHRAEANADVRNLNNTSDEDVLDALELNANREAEGYMFWRDAFLGARHRRAHAEDLDARAVEAAERERKKLAAEREQAMTEAAEKLTRAREARGETPEPPATAPKSSRTKHRKAAG
ncbi:MAG TPA: helix-turn-helix transcriptional regulator [Polyangiaceae bacterium]|jgi:hypothetical protein